MAKLGSPKTNKFMIGTAELRIAPMNEANKLTQAHSIGLIDSATVEVSQESVDLVGGFPQNLIDTAIVSQSAQLTATLREYSRRNIRTLLGAGAGVAVTDVKTTLTGSVAANATSVQVASATGLTAGQMIVFYPEGQPEKVSVCLIDSITTNTLTLNPGTPVLHAYDSANGTIHAYTAEQVAIGNVAEAQYLAVQLLMRENSSGRPIGFSFWKGTIASGMNMATNAQDFASTDLTIKLLQPTETEYGVGGPLEHLASIIPTHPTGMYIGGGDS